MCWLGEEMTSRALGRSGVSCPTRGRLERTAKSKNPAPKETYSMKVVLDLLSRVQTGKTGPSLEKGLSYQPHSLLHPLLLAESCWSVMEHDWGTRDAQRKQEICLQTWDGSGFAGIWTEVFWISILNLGNFILHYCNSEHLCPLMRLVLVLC